MKSSTTLSYMKPTTTYTDYLDVDTGLRHVDVTVYSSSQYRTEFTGYDVVELMAAYPGKDLKFEIYGADYDEGAAMSARYERTLTPSEVALLSDWHRLGAETRAIYVTPISYCATPEDFEIFIKQSKAHSHAKEAEHAAWHKFRASIDAAIAADQAPITTKETQ